MRFHEYRRARAERWHQPRAQTIVKRERGHYRRVETIGKRERGRHDSTISSSSPDNPQVQAARENFYIDMCVCAYTHICVCVYIYVYSYV